MATTENLFTGDGSTTNYSFTFEYIEQSDVKADIAGSTTTDFTFANATTLSFNTAPANGAEVRIYRDTDLDTLKATFFAGSAIKAEDLNNNFTQNNFAVQEVKNNTWDSDLQTIKSNETWVSNDDQIATTAAMDARFQDEATETIESTETWVSDDDHIATTQAIDNRSISQINTAVTTALTSDGTGITIDQSSGSSAEFGLGVGSIDLDRIKSSDIVTSAETNPNNDITIATTAKIDDMIDAAITGDIAVDSSGLTLTDDGDGTITLGIGSNSVDFDSIKDSDIITYAEQDAGSPAPADTNIFTASAAARRFDTIVQTSTPSGSDWEVGKTWLQNDVDNTLSIWDGNSWEGVTSGGTFINQAKVVYVDAVSGNDSNDGHRISRPKATIKAAINQINSEINTSITNGGSGYVDGTYSAVALTGGTGTGLTADITVSSGTVSSVTINSSSTLEDYAIGDILSAADADLGAGGGSGLEITVGGDGDGQVVVVSPGTYQEVAPIQIKRRTVSIVGQALRSCIVHPTVATQNNVLFEVNSGSYIANLTLTGVQAGTGTGNTIDATLPVDQGWNFGFYANAYITKSPYIQNCTNFSDSEIDNSDLQAYTPRGGSAGDTDSAPTGGGLLVNGSTVHSNSPLRSMVCDSYTHVGLNGPGILVTNNGYVQATSSYAFFNKYHIKCLNGGQANLAASTTDFGDESLVADGKSSAAIFTSNVDGAAADLDTTFNINEPTAAAGWHGTATRPQGNMLVTVNGVTYPVLSATANTDSEGGAGWTVTISRPNPSLRSENLGLDGAVSDDATVEFFLRSMIASSGHTMEYVGSGTDYTALPENGGIPDDSKQIVESNGGKVWTAITDQNGKFKIGDFFEVDQRTGFINFSAGSYAFDVVTDTTPQLGGQLDALTNKIVNLSDPTAAQDAATKAYVDSAAGPQDNIIEGNTKAEVVDTGSNGHFKVETEGVERLRIDSSGNVGVGTTGPTHKLHLNDSSASGVFTQYTNSTTGAGTNDGSVVGVTGTGELLIAQREINAIAFRASNIERMRIDSSGRLLVGTSSSLAADSQLQVEGTGFYEGGATLRRNSNDAGGTALRICKSRGTSNGSYSVVSSGDTLGIVQFCGADGTNDKNAAEIRAEVDGTPGSNDMPGRLVFSTTADGASSPTERMRIDSAGDVKIGGTLPASPNIELRANGEAAFASDVFSKSIVADRSDNPASAVFVGKYSGTLNSRINANGSASFLSNVGIGTMSPARGPLHLHSSSVNTYLHITNSTTGDTSSDGFTIHQSGTDTLLNNRESGNLRLYTSGSESARIDSSGRLLVGTSSGVATGSSVQAALQVVDNNNLQAAFRMSRNDSAGPTVAFGKSRSTSDGGFTVVQANDELGTIRFCGADGGDLNTQGAAIAAFVDGTPGANDMPGRLVFSTSADGSSSPTERVRIGSAGQIGLGGANYGTSGQVLTSNGSSSAPTWQDAGGGGAWTLLSTTTASSASTIDINSNIDSTYDRYVIKGSVYASANYTGLRCRFYNNGTILTNSDYYSASFGIYQNSSNAINTKRGEWADYDYASADLPSNFGLSSSSDELYHFEIELDQPNQSRAKYVFKLLGWKGGFSLNHNDLGNGIIGYNNGTTALTNINGIRLFPSTGTLTGTFKLYGIS